MLNKKTIFDREITAIKELFFSANELLQKAPKRGTYHEEPLTNLYVKMLSDQFSHLKDKPIKAIIDCAHGATAAIIPTLVQEMGWDTVKLMYETVDGNFPAHEADPTKAENAKELQHNLNGMNDYVGVSFDGDGDRMAALTEEGTLICGDELSTIFCQSIKEAVGPFKMVVDIKCAGAFLKQFQAWNLDYTLTPCGIGFVRNAIKKTNALFGGELSCHFCFNDRYFGFDDGIYAMMRLIEIIEHKKCTLSTLYHELPIRYCSPEIRIASTNEQKFEIVERIKKEISLDANSSLTTIDGIRIDYPYGSATLRASNTEPVLSARFEGTEKKHLDHIINEFYKLLEPYLDEKYLTKMLKSE